MKKYILVKNTISAVQWTGYNLEEIIELVGEEQVYTVVDDQRQKEQGPAVVVLIIRNPMVEVEYGDYILKTATGEIEVMPKGRFESNFKEMK